MVHCNLYKEMLFMFHFGYLFFYYLWEKVARAEGGYKEKGRFLGLGFMM